MQEKMPHRTPRKIEQNMFIHQTILIIAMAFVMAISGCSIMIIKELQTDDQNLKNIAESISYNRSVYNDTDLSRTIDYFDSLKNSLSNIDVISIVDSTGKRTYHSNHKLIGSLYEGTYPDFEKAGSNCYIENSIGPSGSQRRAYAAIYTSDGEYYGFVIAVILRKNIASQIISIVFVLILVMLIAIAIELLISKRLSNGIKKSLKGYEPDSFSSMFQIRDNILEALKEGIVAVDKDCNILFTNEAANNMLGKTSIDSYISSVLSPTLNTGNREMNLPEQIISGKPIIIDKIPIIEDDKIAGAVAILHNREEYTKLMEDLAGTRYLVDSMRANNHDFTNKLHVILGLIQMGNYEEATSYIENITLVRQKIISQIMHAIDDPTIAALLIGKAVKASELNIEFTLQATSMYHYKDYPLPQESLNTIIGNLIDNAYDAMNLVSTHKKDKNELLFGIHSEPGILLITVDDTGIGMSQEVLKHIFENGFSTKGEHRGTGLYHTHSLIDGLGGTILVDSQEEIGTSFTVTFS